MEVLQFSFEINAFAVTINFIWHFFEYSLMYFLIQSAIYLSIELSYLFTIPYFLLLIQ